MKNNTLNLQIADEAGMVALGGRLAAALPDSGLGITLRGDLGAGKTTLVRAVLRALGVTGHVRSPTYTLVEPYDLGGRQAYHLDLYRLGDPEELEFLGIRDFDPASDLVFVEWPERGGALLPFIDLAIELSVVEQDGRNVDFVAHSERAARLLAELRGD